MVPSTVTFGTLKETFIGFGNYIFWYTKWILDSILSILKGDNIIFNTWISNWSKSSRKLWIRLKIFFSNKELFEEDLLLGSNDVNPIPE